MNRAIASPFLLKKVCPTSRYVARVPGWFFLAATFFLAPLPSSAAVTVSISPSSTNLTTSTTLQFTATVTGSADATVTWTIQEGAAGGSITGAGLYSAPSAVGVYHVVATSNADPTQSATATVGVPGFVQSGLLFPGPCTSTLLPNGTILYTGGGTGNESDIYGNAEIYDPVAGKSTQTGSMVVPRCADTATLLPNGEVLFAGGESGGQTATAELYNPVTGTFAATGSMSVARVNHTATLLPNGKVLIAGGGNCNSGCVAFNTAELFDPSSGTFGPTAGNMFLGVSGSTSTLLSSGKVLIAGGFTSSTDSTGTVVAQLYDPTTGLFAQSGSMFTARQFGFTATLLQSGKVLIAGGVGSGAAQMAAEVYDPMAGTFSQTGSLSIPLEGQSAALLPNGQVLMAGGSTTLSNTANSSLYDPVAGTFSPTGSLVEPRSGASATLLASGNVLIAGGGNGQFLGSLETYDPSTALFTSPTIFMNIGRTGNSMTKLADGRFLLAGGVDANSTPVLRAEIFDPVTNKFILSGSLAAGRQLHTATLLPNGTVLIVGGVTTSAQGPIVSTAEIYDPVSGTFGSAPSNPNVARASHTATLLPSGKALIAGGLVSGGSSGNKGTTATELYDPVAGTFTLSANMLAPRENHTATLLSDGRVLIAEGINDPTAFSTGAQYPLDEVYDPSTGLFVPVGAPGIFEQPTPMPFDSVQWPSGQVLVDKMTVLDPGTLTLSSFNAPGSADSTNLVNFKFTLLPSNQVFVAGGDLPAYLINQSPVLGPPPGLPTYSVAGNLQYNRLSPSTALLPNGEVLIAGGTILTDVEFYVPPVLAPTPVINSISPNPATGFSPLPVTIQGANFTADSTISLDGSPIATTFVSSTELTATVPAVNLTVPGAHLVLVADSSGFVSSAFTLTVSNPKLFVSQPNGSGISYGSIPAGTSSSQSVNFQNSGNAPLTLDSLTVSGANSADFEIDTANTSCPLQGGVLVAQQVCTVAVLFVPASDASFTAFLNLAYESLPGSPFSVPLSGTGAGELSTTIAPPSLAFSNQGVGISSTPQSLTISNSGNVNLSFTSVTLTNMTDFSMANTCLSILNPNASCSMGITFKPTTAGSITGSLVIVTNEATSHTISLSGTGDSFSIAPASGSSTNATVSAGNTATYQLSLAPQFLSGPVAFTCVPVAAIPNATCSVAPNPATVSGSTPRVVTVSVTTMARSGAFIPALRGPLAAQGVHVRRVQPWLLYLLAFMAITMVVATAAAWRKSSRTPLAISAALFLVILVAGCGSGAGYGGGGSTGTPTGTYQLTVTASSGGISSTISLMLTVK